MAILVQLMVINAEGIRINDNKLRIYCYSCVINGDKCGENNCEKK